MKKLNLLIFVLLILTAGCSNNGNDSLRGTWGITEFRMKIGEQENVSNSGTLKNAGAVWDIKLLRDGKFRQDFNMSNPEMKMMTETGSWSAKNDSLFIKIKSDSTTVDINYSYTLNGDTLSLILVSPQKNRVVAKFIRK